jgi:dTDP-4-amino-4,6-dideoxygalactose transaminase
VGLPDGSGPRVAEALDAAGVDSRHWWGQGCHRDAAFADCRREDLPATERLASATLGLPFSIDMDAEDANRVGAALAAAVQAR